MRLRLAQKKDIPSIEALMKESMRTLGRGFYTDDQIASCCEYVCVPDWQLIEDQTFFVLEGHKNELIGCGGWSYRNKLYAGPKSSAEHTSSTLHPEKDSAKVRAMFTHPSHAGKGIGTRILLAAIDGAKKSGFRSAALGATLSGLPFYRAKGWKAVKTDEATLPDGVTIGVVHMHHSL